MKILHLNLKKKWFVQIRSGNKRAEFRLAKPYWMKRLFNKKFDIVRFKNGYQKDAPTFDIEWISTNIWVGIYPETNKIETMYRIQLGKLLTGDKQ